MEKGQEMKLEKSLLYPRNTRTRRAVGIDGLWGFRFDAEGRGESLGWQNGLPEPAAIPVPSSFNDYFTDKAAREYVGDFWYESEVFVPGEWKGGEVFLRFGCATHRAQVYFNGEKINAHEGGFTPFSSRITELVRWDEENHIAVRLNNELLEYCLPAGKCVVLPDGQKVNKPNFDFFNYAGLQRPVFLTRIPREAVTDFSVDYELEENSARINYSVETTGENRVTFTLLDEEGREAAACCGKAGTAVIRKPHLWQIRDAYLYRAVIRIWDGEQVVDEYWENIGIRTVQIRGEEILVNGKPVYLKGFGKHEDSDFTGRGFNPGVMKRDVELMKWAGANRFRTSHYPYSEEIYQMADREGFLVIDEAPAVGLYTGLLNLIDTDPKGAPYFDKETTPQLLENHLNAVREMIVRDKNHPCVFAWSLLNEPDSVSQNAEPYFSSIFELARKLDPQRRPKTFAMISDSSPEACRCCHLSDFLCLNRYYGWYYKGGTEIVQGERLLRDELDRWAGKNMGKPIVFTEYGADTCAGVHKLPSVMWSEEYQIEFLEMCHRVFDSYGFVKGEQVWNFADFQTVEGTIRVDGNKKGIFTRQRQPKAAAFYLKRRWESLKADYKSGSQNTYK